MTSTTEGPSPGESDRSTGRMFAEQRKMNEQGDRDYADHTFRDGLQHEVLVIVGLALFCYFFVSSACIPILPNLLSEAFSPFSIGVIFAAKPAVQFVANPAVGHVVDVIGPLVPLLVGVLTLCASTVLLAVGVAQANLHSAFGLILLSRAAQGAAGAATTTSAMTLVALTHHEGQRGEAMSRAMLGVALGSLLGPPLGGVLSTYTTPWLVFALAVAALLLDLGLQWQWLHGGDTWAAVAQLLDAVDGAVGACCGAGAARREDAGVRQRLLQPDSESGDQNGSSSSDGNNSSNLRQVDEFGLGDDEDEDGAPALAPGGQGQGQGQGQRQACVHGAGHRAQFISAAEQADLRSKSTELLSVAGTDGGSNPSCATSRPVTQQYVSASGPEAAWDRQFAMLHLLRDPHVMVLVLVSVAGNSCTGMIGPLLPLYLRHHFHESVVVQGAVLSCITVAYLLGTPVAGLLADQQPKRTVLCGGIATVGVGLCLFMFSSSSVAVVCVCLLLTGAGMSCVDTPALPFLSAVVAARPSLCGSLGMVYALNDMGYCAGFTLGPLIGAVLEEAFGKQDEARSFRLTALCAGLLALAVVPFALTILPPGNPVHTPAAAPVHSGRSARSPRHVNGDDDDDGYGVEEEEQSEGEGEGRWGRETIRNWDRDGGFAAPIGIRGAGGDGRRRDRSSTSSSTGSGSSVPRSAATPPLLTRHHVQQWQQLHQQHHHGEEGLLLPIPPGSREGEGERGPFPRTTSGEGEAAGGVEVESDDAVL